MFGSYKNKLEEKQHEKVLGWAWAQDVGGPDERAVLVAMAWHYDSQDGIRNPGVPTLTKMTHIKPAAVKRALKGLVEKGLISPEKGGES